ncbi:MAG: DEAD/DEAH box helicase family protein [Solirubrobacterales bacterium]|nr:DEAD/DEAH box helicase family protein [Solirubrobacterales bacterium]
MSDVEATLPARWSKRLIVDGNQARQLRVQAVDATIKHLNGGWIAEVDPGDQHELRARGDYRAGESGLEIPRSKLDDLPAEVQETDFYWAGSPEPSAPGEVLESLDGQFSFREEDPDANVTGLRVPQAGALHAIIAHWSTGSTEPATVVLPTGTGKTETMIASFAHDGSMRVLVLVPTTALRIQIAEAFEKYGVLANTGVVGEGAEFPVVGRIEHAFSNVNSMKDFVSRCNVVVATSEAIIASSNAVVRALNREFSHLFVDEAHHLGSPSWAHIRDSFAPKPILQFTATPYRTDGVPIGGRLIYSFPLRKAQELGYFQQINYIAATTMVDQDLLVARTAIEKLHEDRAAGYDHLVMARVQFINRAQDEVFPIYEELAAEFHPKLIHSRMSSADRNSVLEAINRRESRIVVCVDMLGEGFDLPELKIAALHDPHRTLGVSLQFIGRFSRGSTQLGPATAIVPKPEPGFDPRLNGLFAEDPDWNEVLHVLATGAVEVVEENDQFDAGFTDADETISRHSLRPKMSAAVYRVPTTDWNPERISEPFPPDDIVSPPSVNHERKVVWLVVEKRSPIHWGSLKTIENTEFHLHLAHFDSDQNLLYIYTSDLKSLQKDIAEAICGEDAEVVSDTPIFRALSQIKRPLPTTIGLLDLRHRARRFSMFVGSDVYEGFATADQQSKSHTNLNVVGYEDGERVSLGVARKGRVWNHQAAQSIQQWVSWCQHLSPKLNDESADLEAIFRNFVRPQPLEERPELSPLAIDWPWIAFAEMSVAVQVVVGDESHPLIDAEFRLTSHETDGPIQFNACSGPAEVPYEATVDDGKLRFSAVGDEVHVKRMRSDPEVLSDYLNREGAMIWFENETFVEGSTIFELDRAATPIDQTKLVPINWGGVNIRRESQGQDRDPSTVQARAAQHLATLDAWDVVVDDDTSGEIADLVAMRVEGESLIIQLVHCKFSSQDDPGARVKDLYEVCGQTHRSAHYRQDVAAMVANLVRRERRRQEIGRDGMLLGTPDELLEFQDLVRTKRAVFRISIAQPGLSKAAAGPNQLNLLGAADLYVSDIAVGVFDVWCSA